MIWAFCSDAMISDWGRSLPHGYLELLRGANNVVLFSIATIVLYRRLRKQQRQLILSEEQYRNLFDSNPNPMWIYHKKTLAFIAVNDAATIKYGYSRDEFLNMTIKDIRPAEDLVLLDESIKNDNGSTGKSNIWQHLRKSGEVFPVSIVSHNVWFNQGSCKMVMATDITLARKNEQILRDSYLKEKELREELAVNYELIRKSEKENKFIAQVIDRINNLVLVVTEDGIISWVNRAFTDFTGYTADEVIGKNPGHILFGPETDSETIKRLIQSTQQKKYFSEELVNYKKSGESYWTQLAISPIYDENGNFQFFMSVETIITERKEKEQKILAQHAALQKIAWS
ncbi:MAG TPA: PAS domain S-box protein, partial [Mucilaginibacter sp.]